MQCTTRHRFTRRRRGVSSIIGMIFFILILFAALTVFSLLFNSFMSYTKTVNNVDQQSILNQETSLSVSDFTFGSPLVSLGSSAPPGVTYLVPILLTNSQTSPVSGYTPIMLNLNWNTYSAYLDNPVDNILFFDASGNSLNAWIENGTANTITNSIVWVQLNSTGIPASSSITIYLGFYALGTNNLSPSGPLGEAPQLTGTYAQYDDGSQVFSAYVNGNTPTTQFNLGANIALAQATGVTYGTGTINALQLTGSGTYVTMVYDNVALPNVPMTAESNFETQAAPTSQGAVSLDDNVNPSSSQNAIAVDQGYAQSYFSNAYELSGGYTFDQNQQGTATTTWYFASVTYSGLGAGSWSGYIAPELYTAGTGYSGTVNNNPLGSSSSIYLSTLSDASATYPDNMYYNWMRVRILPANGIMPDVSFGSVIAAGSSSIASTVGTSSSESRSYVPITITNSQTSPTPNPFQQQISWNPSTYSTYEASNLGNIRFCSSSSCTTELYAWLQQCGTSFTSCSTSSTSATVWVRLTSSIAANGGALTIYMVFLSNTVNFDANYWGESPLLSGTYGQYDNGPNVFNIYDNFAGGTLSSSWTAVSNGRGHDGVGNGITFTTTRNSGYAFVWWNTLQNYPQVGETYVSSVGGGTEPIIGVSTSANTNGYTALYNGVSLAWVQGTNTIILSSQTGGGGTTVGTAAVSNTFTPGIWGITWSGSNAESGTAQAGSVSGTSSPTIGNYAIYIGETTSATGSDSMSWARMRSYPPDNVMPAVSVGSLVSGSGVSTSYSFERKLVYSQNLWWAFYSDGTNIGYSTSSDGSTWSTETIVTSSTGSATGYDFNVWLSGNTLYYELTANGQSSSFLWRYGTLQNSGSISWSIPETIVTTTNIVYSYSSIATDSSGNVWVALNTFDGTNTHIAVWEYTSGSWSKVNDISPVSADTAPILVPVSSGIVLVYGAGGSTQTVKVTATSNGASWSSPVSPASYYAMFSSSAVSIGNTVYFAGLASGSTGATSGAIDFWSYAFGASQTSSETQLQSSSSTWMSSISEELSRTLVVFYGSGTNVYELYSVNAGATWYSRTTMSVSESSITGLTSSFTGNGLMWTSGTSNPFSIRFASIPTLSVSNNSPFPVHIIGLYIYNPTTNSIIHFDTESSGSGVAGPFDYWLGTGETVSVPLSSFKWTTNQNYLITITTDQGIRMTSSLISPP